MSDVIDLEREKNVKEHGPLGALIETAAEREPDEVDVLGRVYELVKDFDSPTRSRMWHWLDARINSDQKRRI